MDVISKGFIPEFNNIFVLLYTNMEQENVIKHF